MPLFIIETTAESPIREFWQVEAATAREARDKFDNGEVGAFLWDEVTGDETEREVSLVHGPGDLDSTVAIHRAQQAAPAMLAALQHMRDEWCEGGFLDGTESEQIILAAIAAATGAPTCDDAATAAAANLSRAGLIEAAGEALALAGPTDEGAGLWRIVQGQPDSEGALYWSNHDGWGGLAGSDGFSEAERATVNLPMGGAWWFDADEDDCASCADAIETRLLPCDECGALDGEE